MTRETKIGLLVGLAFIIVIGILLSDHLSSTNEPPQAQLSSAGDTVRQGVGLPANPTPQPPITLVPPVQVAPTQPVPTREELTRPLPSPVAQVNPATDTATIRPQAIDPQLRHIAEQFKNELEPVAPAGSRGEVAALTPAPQIPATGFLSPVNAAATHEYKVVEGDSVSRLAAKFLGASTKTTRQAIIDANPSLKADPNRIIVGRTYIIPATASTVARPAETTVILPTPATVQKPRQTPSSSPEYWYTVKDNDNLWRIAYEQLGNGNAWTAIKELNVDALKGGDTVHPNMRLKLPAKPLASAR